MLPFDLKSLIKAKYEIIPGVEIETYGSMTVEELIKFTQVQKDVQNADNPFGAMVEFVAWIMAKRTGNDLWTVEAVLQLPQNIVQDIIAFFGNGEKIIGEANGGDEGNAQLIGGQSIGGLDSISQESNDSIVSNSGIAL